MRKWIVGIALLCISLIGLQAAIEALRPKRPDVELILNAALTPGRLTIKDVVMPDERNLITIEGKWLKPEPFEVSLDVEIKELQDEISSLTESINKHRLDEAQYQAGYEKDLSDDRVYLENLQRIKKSIGKKSAIEKPAQEIPLKLLKLDPRIKLNDPKVVKSPVALMFDRPGALEYPTFSPDRKFAYLALHGHAYHSYFRYYFLERTGSGWKVIAKGGINYL